MFYGCIELENIDFSINNESTLFNASFAFSGCISLKNVILPDRMIYLESTNNMFEGCSNLTSINLEFLKGASHLSTFSGMFKGCSNLREINFPEIGTNLVMDMSEMFSGCNNLIISNLEELRIEKILDMSAMFSGCKNLKYLNIYNIDTRNIASFDEIFKDVNENVTIVYNPNITDISLINEIENISKNNNQI